MDGTVVYSWNPGSLPPPSYYEVRIEIAPGGESVLEARPDHPFNDPPAWRWRFDASAAARARLRQAVAGSGEGGRETALSVGGAQESVVIRRRDRETPLAPGPALSAAIREAVPQDVWSALEARRAEYAKRRE